MGVGLIAAPRATEATHYERWKLVMRANAVTAAAYLISVNRPPEDGASLGGPSVAIAPDGEVLSEGEDMQVVEIDPSRLEEARAAYPGYLGRFPELYARGWSGLARRD